MHFDVRYGVDVMAVLLKTAFFFPPRKNGHEIETSFPHQHLIQGA